jgi:hypothetical protein
MEQENQTITSVSLQDGIISIVYDNGEVENLQRTKETFVAMHNKWLVSQPPFISDLYKVQMRNIILATINNNEKCICDLCTYFSEGNELEVVKFLTYMRKRDLTEEKNKWTPQAPQASQAP